MRSFFDYALLELLPFWQHFFDLIASVAWPLALIAVFLKLRPLISQILSERGFSFEGFGTHLRVEERKNAQIADAALAKNRSLANNLQLPRTIAIDEEEKRLLSAIEQIPAENRHSILLNALAIERLEKRFAFTYLNIFGSQMFFLQRINERGGAIPLLDAQGYFSEIRSRFPEFSDWDFEKYSAFLVRHGLVDVSDKVKLTPAGTDFIHFIVRYGLSTEKPL